MPVEQQTGSLYPSRPARATSPASRATGPRHVWTSNDINDIDALFVAVPYCDAVFTDKAARDKVISCPELAVFETEMPRKPEDLADWLDGLPAV